jgi:hypothetical protein
VNRRKENTAKLLVECGENVERIAGAERITGTTTVLIEGRSKHPSNNFFVQVEVQLLR